MPSLAAILGKNILLIKSIGYAWLEKQPFAQKCHKKLDTFLRVFLEIMTTFN
jgi:hypothetical protein